MASAPQHHSWNHCVDQRIEIIADGLRTHDALRDKLPGLKSLLDDYLSGNEVSQDAGREAFHRRLLQVFRDSEADSTYGEWLKRFHPDEQRRIADFVDGRPAADVGKDFSFGPSLGVREHMKLMRQAEGGPVVVDGLNTHENVGHGSVFQKLLSSLVAAPFKPSKGDSIIVYENAPFQNWGRVVDYVPSFTCIPSTVAGVQRIVQYAKSQDMGVRCAGFRHSWAPIFGRNGQITISLLGLHEATKVPNFTAMSKALPVTKPTELESIEIVQGTPRVAGNALVRIGASTTNERLRRWCVDNNQYTYPLNVIMVEMTVGGTNAPICHGAGRRHPTLSDLVRKVEYVDCHGNLRSVEDPEHLRAASGCFGLMGVVTHLTLEFAPMTYALMAPQKIPVVQAVPPPDGMRDEDIPAALRVPRTPEQRAGDVAEFERQCNDNYYAEYFWFPYADMCWVNNWNDTTDAAGVVDYPSNGQTFLMFISQFTMNVLQYSNVLQELIEAVHLDTAAVTLISRAAMLALPAWDKPVKTYLTDALHFQRGIQNVRVLDVEVEMPLQPKAGQPDKPDYNLVRRAWWDAILECYKHSDTCPQRMPLEMRIMGGSDVIMAPQRGNELGTCSIEVLTLESAADLWKPYAEGVLSKWLSYTDAEGKPLRTRPHWAKQWDGFDIDGKSWAKKLKQDYAEEIVEFKNVLAEIGKKDGWELADLKKRFSNDFFDEFYFDDVDV